MTETRWTTDLNVLGDITLSRRNNIGWGDIYSALCKKYEYDFHSPESLRKRFSENEYRLEGMHQYLEEPSNINYEEAYAALCGYVGKKTTTKQPVAKNKKRTKILVMSDTHIPFHNEKVMREIVELHKDADCLVIPGDILDCYAVSRFSKKKQFPLKDELTIAVSIFDWLVSVFPKIIILEGNHTDRVRKYFESRIDPSLLFLVKYDLLELIASPYSNVQIVKESYQFPNGNGSEVINYFTKVGEDCLIGHFETSSKMPMKAAMTAYEWLTSWGNYFNINKITLFLQAHTHRLSKYPVGDGTTVVGETGCVAQIQDYAVDSGAKYSAHLNGYWIVYQDNGITDINASNFYICK